MSDCKFGFHCGPAGNHTGIGEYMRRLDEAGRPMVIKSVDHYGHIYEASQYGNAPHVLVFRLSAAGQPGDYNYDVPDYGKAPAEAAREHWRETVDRLPPEFDKEQVWLEPINEVDHERSDWLGHFAAEIGMLALADGYKLLLFAWSSGEPEPENWETPGMLRYLRLCARHPQKLGVALHEYSYDVGNIWRLDGELVGRFTQLFDVCDAHGIARPSVVMTEWGWELWDVPRPQKAMADIAAVGALYSQYPEVLGAAIWYLGGGWQDIHNQTQKLIAPVTEYALAGDYELPEPPGPPPPPPVGGELPYAPETTHVILHPRQLTAGQRAAVGQMMRDGVAGVVPGFAGWAHTTAINAVAAAVQAGHAESRLIVVDGEQIGTGLDAAWMRTHHAGLMPHVVFVDGDGGGEEDGGGDDHPIPPPPPPGGGAARLGLHADARGGDVSADEVAMFAAADVEMIKVLSSTSPDSVRRLRAACPDAAWVVRAFLDFGRRDVMPEQFFGWTVGDVARTLTALDGVDVVVELHNEPNLYAEGLASSWWDGHSFNEWYLELLQKYRQQLPGVRFIFPGLSPGGDVAGVRMAHRPWWAACAEAMAASDGVGAHVYWSDGYPLDGGHADGGLTLLDDSVRRLAGHEIWITEASRNDGRANRQQLADEYVRFWRMCRRYKAVRGVTYFVASAAPGTFEHETWDMALAAAVGARQ